MCGAVRTQAGTPVARAEVGRTAEERAARGAGRGPQRAPLTDRDGATRCVLDDPYRSLWHAAATRHPRCTVHVRPLDPADREAASQLSMRAFTATPNAPYDPDRVRVPDERRWVAEHDGRLVGHLGAWEFGHHLGGRRLATAGICAVVVAPEARGRGVGSAMLRAGLQAARERGDLLASLFPLTRGVYRAHGFELAGAHPVAVLDTTALATIAAPADDVVVTPGTVDDLPAMLALEAELTRAEPAGLDRGEVFGTRALTPGDDGTIVLARRGGELTGYLVYGHAPADSRGGFYRLDVTELVGRDADTLRALWRVLGSSHTAAPTATAVVAPEDPLELWLPERAWQAPPTTWRWMTRVLDPAGVVAARGWPVGIQAAVPLELRDPLWPEHDGAWVLELDGRGAGQLTRGGDGRVAIDVGALASWLTGWASATRLRRYGRLHGATAPDVAALDAATASATPWIRSFF